MALEDGTGGARRDACTALYGPSDDIGLGLDQDSWCDTRLPNPREAWGQTLQLRQRTQADDPGLGHSSRQWPQEACSAGPTMGGIILTLLRWVGSIEANAPPEIVIT